MGLTITATFEEQGIYFAGETLECHIRFANVCSTQNPLGNPRSLPTSRQNAGLPRGDNTQSQYSASRKSTGRVPFQRVVGGASNSERRTLGEVTHFPSLDANSEYSASSAVLCRPTDARRYSVIAGTKDDGGGSSTSSNSHRQSPAKANRSIRAAERENNSNGVNNTHDQAGKSGLAIFPVLGETSPAPSDLLPPLDTHRLYRGSTGTYGGRTPQERLPSISSRMQLNTTKGRASTTASPIEGTSTQARQSTSSMLSTPPSASFTSWLPFASRTQKQQQQQQLPRQPGLGQIMRQKSARNSHADAPASDTGSSGILSNLWRNLSGGSNPPSLPSTRAGSVVEEHSCFENLALGFAEISGSLALATPYIKPEQMELLLTHKGTDYIANKKIGSPPMGGGLGGWAPAGPNNRTSSRSQKTLPLVISSPTVLFSELALGPGESQTFSIKVQLPKSLPPSFRGRTGSISYDLVVVAKQSMLESSTYVVRIPFRVLAFVDRSGTVDTFSMAHPVQMAPDHIKLTYQDEITVSTPRNTSPSFDSDKNELPQLGSCSKSEALCVEFLPPLVSLENAKESTSDVYKQLTSSSFLQSLIDSIGSDVTADPQVVPSIELSSQSTTLENGHNDSYNDPMQNIQIACRKRAPVFFSLSQDGHAVASVWLPKRVYQLGDMVSGRLDIHQGSASVYQVSIWLESVETVGSAFASYSQSRTEELTRRVYSEHHEFCRSTQTLGFSLAAPQPATAAASFNSSILTNVWQLRIELIIGTSDLAAASDYVLSAATPFPPAKQPYHASTDPRSSVLLMPAKGVPPMLPVDGQAALATKLRPIVPASASGSMSSRLTSNPRNGNSRLRSSTIADSGSVGVIGAVHCQGHHKSHDSDPKTIQPQSHVAADTIQRTVRRRYDAAHIIASQTLSCTVAIQMHPSSLKQLPAGHRDTYTVDLTSQGR